MLLLNTNRKYMYSILIPPALIWPWMISKGQVKAIRFWRPIAGKGAEVSYMLLLNTIGKSYIVYTWGIQLHYVIGPWVSASKSLIYQTQKAVQLGQILLLITDRKSYSWTLHRIIKFDLGCPREVMFKVHVYSFIYIIFYVSQNVIYM